MQTYFNQVDHHTVSWLSYEYSPDALANAARSLGEGHEPAAATVFSLASIRARGNWISINGHWHKRQPYLA